MLKVTKRCYPLAGSQCNMEGLPARGWQQQSASSREKEDFIHQEVNHGKGQQQQAHRRQRRIQAVQRFGCCLRPCSQHRRRSTSITRQGTSLTEHGADIVLQDEAKRIIMFAAKAGNNSTSCMQIMDSLAGRRPAS